MKNWKAIAKVALPQIPDQEVDRLLEPLAALEESFRPLVRQLTPDVEPAISFHIERASE